MKEIMTTMRNDTPTTIGKYEVLSMKDYENDIDLNMKTMEKTSTNLPKSDVLYYELSDNAWCCVRPSGTEPKIKFYFGVKENSMEEAQKALDELSKAMLSKIEE